MGRDDDAQARARSGDLRERIGESLRTSGPLWTASLALERILPVNVLGRWPGRRVPAQRLRAQVLAILAAWGMPEQEASTTAGHLLYADLCGIDSHGVGMLLHYHRALRDGSVTIPADITVVSEGATSLAVGDRECKWGKPPTRGGLIGGRVLVMSTTTPTSALAVGLQARGFVGRLVEPGDLDYDTARAGWNGAIDRRPAAVAYATDADDVAAAMRAARPS